MEKKASVYVINRENVVWLCEKHHWDFDMIVIDELSSFKSYQAKRFKALRRYRPKAIRVVGLTGTPGNLMDLWAEIGILDMGQRLGRYIGAYRDRFFLPDKRNRNIIYSYKPRDGAEEAIYNLISDICISMKAEDYLSMPECLYHRVEVRMDEKEEKLYRQMEKDMLASILMMLTIMFIANGSATIMSHGNELTRTSAVYDFTVMGEEQNIEQYLSDEQMRVYVANLNRMETGNMKRPASGEMKSFVDWSVLRKEIVQNLPEGVIDPATQEAASYELGSHQPAALNLLGFIDTGSVAPYMLPVSSYNRLLEAAGEKQINLENDEAVFYLNPDFLGKAQEDTIALLDRIAENAQTSGNALISIDKKSVTLVPSVPMKGLTADENVKIVTALIVSDEIYHNYVDPDTCSVYWNFCIPNELVEANGLMLSVMEARDLLKPSGLYYESYLDNFGRQLFYLISGSYTTLYMGFMLLIIACALLALQFLTQMQSTKLRYLTLSILGAQREQIKRSIYKQVLWYFLLPLMLACISGTVGLYAMQQHLYSDSTKIGQSYPLLIIMAFTVVLIMAVYGVAVARTATREIGKINYKPNS